MNRVEQGSATRERLLGAARDLFAARGYQQTSIEDVLRSTGVSRGALYHHFTNKQELFEGVLELIETEMVQRITGAAAKADPAEALRAGCHAFLDLADDPVIRQIALTDAPAALGWERWREIEAEYGLGLIKAALEQQPVGARLDSDGIDYVAHVVLAALIELGMMLGRADDAAEAKRHAHDALDVLLAQLVPAR